jgi:hypothetical protein
MEITKTVTTTKTKGKAPGAPSNGPPPKGAPSKGNNGKQPANGKPKGKQPQAVRNVIINPEHVKEVIKSITLPGIKNDVRYSSAFTTGETSLSQLKQPLGVRFIPPASTGDNEYQPLLDTPESSCGFVFRDPVRNLVLYDANPTNEGFSYKVVFRVGNNGEETTNTIYTGSAGPLNIAYLEADTADYDYYPHGIISGVGLSNGNKTYIWCQSNFTWTMNATSNNVVLLAYKWTPRGEVFLFATLAVNVTAQFKPHGYCRFEAYRISTVDAGAYMMNPITATEQFSLTYNATGAVWAHKALPQYDDKVTAVEKMRVLSQGLLFTNTTPDIARGGKIATKQLPGDEPWYEYAESGYDSFSKLSNVDIREASDGVYGYLKPTAISDFEMADNVDLNMGTLCTYGFDLDSVRSYMGYYAVLPSAAGQSAQFTSLTNIEFETDDQWYSQGESKIDPSVFESAVHTVAKIPQYEENPLHLGNMLAYAKSFAGKVAKFIGDYGPTAMKIAEVAGPMLAAL